jgi:hypothetical protein
VQKGKDPTPQAEVSNLKLKRSNSFIDCSPAKGSLSFVKGAVACLKRKL